MTTNFYNGTMYIVSAPGDVVRFGNGGTLAGPATVNVGSGSVGGLIFGATTGSGYLLTASAAETLTIGSSGIVVNSGAQTTTLGSATLGLALSANQSWINNSANSLNVLGTVNLGANRLTLVNNLAGVQNFREVISGAGGVTLAGPATGGTIVFTGGNTYTGDTVISRGTLLLDFTNSLQTTNLINHAALSSKLVLGGGTLGVLGKTGALNSQQFNGTDLTAGASVISLTQNNATTLTLDLGAINRSAGATLNFANAPSANVVVPTTSGTTNDLLGTWASVGSSTSFRYATVSGGSIVAYTGGTATANGSDIADTTGTVNYDVGAAGTIPAGRSINTLRAAATGAMTTTIGGAFSANGLMNSGSGAWSLTGSPITIGSSGELVILSNTAGITISSSIVGNGRLVYSGPGTLSLIGVGNTLNGGLLVNTGTVSVGSGGNNANLGVGAVTVMGGAIFRATGSNLAFTNALVIGGTGDASSIGTGNGSSPSAFSGGVTGANNLQLYSNSSGAMTFTNKPIDIDGTIGTQIVNAAGNLIITTSLGANVKGFLHNSVGQATLSNANPLFTGTVAVTVGRLNINHTSALGTGTLTLNGGSLDTTLASALTLTTNNAQVWGSGFSFLGTRDLNLGTGVVTLSTGATTITVTANTLTVGGVISSATATGALTKTGAGTLALGGANLFTGGVTVNAGVLQLNNAAALNAVNPNAVTLANTGVLRLNGNGVTLPSSPLI